MTYAIVTSPGAEALTLGEVKTHLRIDGGDEDELLQRLVAAAREHLERVAGLALIGRDMRLYLDRWPASAAIEIAYGPVRSVTDIRVYDELGVEAAVDLAGHILDAAARPARLWLRSRPSPRQAMNGIEIDFTAGFGDTGADVPDTLKRAMLTHIALMYEFRGAVSPDGQPAAVPEGYERLIAPFAMRRL